VSPARGGWLGLKALVILSGCEPAPPAAPPPRVTYERPEIGKLFIYSAPGEWQACTATLIRPRVLLSAAHCVAYQSRRADPRDRFLIASPEGRLRLFPLAGYRSLSGTRQGGEDDLALLLLEEPLPAALATPATLAPELPRAGQALFLGFGCGCRDGAGVHRKCASELALGGAPSRILCDGDSGGPLLTPGAAEVFAIASGHRGGADVFAPVAGARRAELLAAIEALEQGR
jgi:protease YdgD